MGNVPLSEASPAAEGVIHYLYFGVKHEIFPALIFLGVGAMTDFSAMLSQPRLILLGADRFFWASDYPHADHTGHYLKALEKLAAQLPEDARARVLGNNVREVYGLRV